MHSMEGAVVKQEDEETSNVKKCEFCNFTTKYTFTLENHIKKSHVQKEHLQCELCEFTAPERNRLIRHTKAVHDKIKDHKCDMCEYEATEAFLVKSHKKAVHFNIRDKSCDQCEYGLGVTSEQHVLNQYAATYKT